MSNMKRNCLMTALALLFVVLLAVSAKVIFVNAEAAQVSGKMIAENHEASSPALVGSSFQPQVLVIGFLIMVGGALGVVLLNSHKSGPRETGRKNNSDSSKSE